jgi:hypothetical protein
MENMTDGQEAEMAENREQQEAQTAKGVSGNLQEKIDALAELDNSEGAALESGLRQLKAELDAAIKSANTPGEIQTLRQVRFLAQGFLNAHGQAIDTLIGRARAEGAQEAVKKAEKAAESAKSAAKLAAVARTRNFLNEHIEGFDLYSPDAQNYFSEITAKMVERNPEYHAPMKWAEEHPDELEAQREESRKAYETLKKAFANDPEALAHLETIQQTIGVGNDPYLSDAAETLSILDTAEPPEKSAAPQKHDSADASGNGHTKQNDAAHRQLAAEKLEKEARRVREVRHKADEQAAEALQNDPHAEDGLAIFRRRAEANNPNIVKELNQARKEQEAAGRKENADQVNKIAKKKPQERTDEEKTRLTTTAFSVASDAGVGLTAARGFHEQMYERKRARLEAFSKKYPEHAEWAGKITWPAGPESREQAVWLDWFSSQNKISGGGDVAGHPSGTLNLPSTPMCAPPFGRASTRGF